MLVYVEINLKGVKNSYNYKYALLRNQIGSCELLVLGSSHSLYNLNPSVFKIKSFNLAGRGQSLYYDSKLLKKYISESKSLKCVVITFSYFTLKYDFEKYLECWRKYFYERYYDIKPETGVNIFDLKRLSYFTMYGNRESFNMLLKNFNVDYTDNMDSLGFISYPVSEGYRDNSELRLKIQKDLMNEKSVKPNIGYLQEIIETCKEKKIKLIFVTTPMSEDFRIIINNDEFHDEIQILNRYIDNQNTYYYNYASDNNFNKNDFYDADHLNYNGANKLSAMLNERIINTFK